MVTLDPSPAVNKVKDFKAQIFMRMGHLTTLHISKNMMRTGSGRRPSGLVFLLCHPGLCPLLVVYRRTICAMSLQLKKKRKAPAVRSFASISQFFFFKECVLETRVLAIFMHGLICLLSHFLTFGWNRFGVQFTEEWDLFAFSPSAGF